MFKPMLASKAPEDLNDIVYPVLASPKLDGIRCLRPIGMEPVTRSMKSIPNKHIAKLLSEHLTEGFDGEIIAGTFNETQSAVMSVKGEPNFEFHVFDCIGIMPFYQRLVKVNQFKSLQSWIKEVKHILISSSKELEEYEEKCLEQGYEGVMIRSYEGPYKFGRSTIKEGYLLKLKRFAEDEGAVIGFEELMHNGNEATKDAFGRTKRSSHKENKIGKDTLGKLILEFNGHTFGVGTGFTAKQREAFWVKREELIGKQVTFKHQKSGGKDAPRFPVFKCFRKDKD